MCAPTYWPSYERRRMGETSNWRSLRKLWWRWGKLALLVDASRMLYGIRVLGCNTLGLLFVFSSLSLAVTYPNKLKIFFFDN